jgi:hypothetical protein
MAQIHFEIFCRQARTDWSLLEAVESRELALSRAREIFADGKAAAVKVVKETLQPGTGDYMSLTIFEEAHPHAQQAKKKKKAEDPESPLHCFKPDDLYSYHARMTIARLAGDWLARQRLTVTEFLHSAQALERFEATGTSFQHAIQKLAVAEASGSEIPVTQIVKDLNKLCAAAMARVYKDERRGAFQALTPGQFGAYANKISSEPAAEYLLKGALAKYLAPAKGWDEKLQRLLALMGELPSAGPGRTVLLASIDSVVAEVLTGAVALADLLGPNPDLGHALLNMVQLFLGVSIEGNIGSGAGLNQLAAYLATDELPNARAAVAGRILSELKSFKRLCPNSLEDELKMMRQLANKLVRGQGKYLSHDDLITAFTDRSKRLVAPEPISQMLHAVVNPDEKIDRLLDIEENIVGAEHKRTLASFMIPILTLPAFETQLLRGAPPLQRLKRIAELQDRVLRSGLQDFHKRQMADALDALACAIEKRASFLAAMEIRVTSPVEKAQAILKMWAANVFTEGELAAKARRQLLAALGTPEFLNIYLAQRQQTTQAQVDRTEAVKELLTELERVGIPPEDGLRAIAA